MMKKQSKNKLNLIPKKNSFFNDKEIFINISSLVIYSILILFFLEASFKIIIPWLGVPKKPGIGLLYGVLMFPITALLGYLLSMIGKIIYSQFKFKCKY